MINRSAKRLEDLLAVPFLGSMGPRVLIKAGLRASGGLWRHSLLRVHATSKNEASDRAAHSSPPPTPRAPSLPLPATTAPHVTAADSVSYRR